jgi:hypothetical protein
LASRFAPPCDGDAVTAAVSAASAKHFLTWLVQMPAPIQMSAKVLNPFSSDLRGKHRTKMVPPKPHRLVANINTALVQKVFDIAK